MGALTSAWITSLLEGAEPVFPNRELYQPPAQTPTDLPLYFPREEYEERWRNTYALMAKQGLDAAVLWSRTAGSYDRSGNSLYLTHYFSNQSGTGSGGSGYCSVIMANGKTPLLIADERPIPNMIATDDYISTRRTFAATAEALKTRGIKGRVALVGADILPMEGWLQLQQDSPGIEWVVMNSGSLLAPLRMIKSARELEACRTAGAITSRALTAQIEALRDGKTESEAAGEAAREMYKGGGHVHRMLISHGKYTENIVTEHVMGHSHLAPKLGDLVRGWVYGPAFQGYWMDPGRTSVRGKPTAGQRELIEATAGVVNALVANIKPGRKILEVSAIGDNLVNDFKPDPSGMAEQWTIFGHGVGHGFEGPSFPSLAAIRQYAPERYDQVVAALANETFKESMVMGVEVFMARKGVGGAGFETNIIITKDRAEVVTPTPMLWW
jgi:Xaa-Pro aminopeptidase